MYIIKETIIYKKYIIFIIKMQFLIILLYFYLYNNKNE